MELFSSSPPAGVQPELLDLYTVNLHRIEKDVQRCDRNYWYFTPANLEKLRNIMCRWLERGTRWGWRSRGCGEPLSGHLAHLGSYSGPH